MRRLLPAVALGGLLALLAVGLVLALRPGVEPSAAERTDALARELRCPDCQGLSVADSPTRSAQEIRRQISSLVAGGAGDEEVRGHFVARYGEWILLAPSSPAYWVIPFAV
ncbi:MAG: cytochrome c-type biogenesis protein CcmH, partial [Chloroflexi bacterium]|nr:cytochrome c-type biogenesis protein CcmH [Chloroflexota bacterium]